MTAAAVGASLWWPLGGLEDFLSADFCLSARGFLCSFGASVWLEADGPGDFLFYRNNVPVNKTSWHMIVATWYLRVITPEYCQMFLVYCNGINMMVFSILVDHPLWENWAKFMLWIHWVVLGTISITWRNSWGWVAIDKWSTLLSVRQFYLCDYRWIF